MNKLFGIFSLALILLFTACNSSTAEKEEIKEVKKIVSTDGSLTEIIYALGFGNDIVATDVTSTFPEEAKTKADLGHAKMMTAENILSKEPTDVIGYDNMLSPELVQQLESAGVKVTVLEREFSLDGSKRIIKEVASWLDVEEKGQELISKLDSDVKSLKSLSSKPKVLFIYARGAAMMMVAGEETQMDSFIKLAGGENAAKGFKDFKPLTPESVIEANPDLILMFNTGVESLSGIDAIFEIPGVKLTKAGKNKAYLEMDGLFMSGFGPRLGEALHVLNKKLVEL